MTPDEKRDLVPAIGVGIGIVVTAAIALLLLTYGWTPK